MLDLSGVPREYLVCRATAHSWDHGPAPIQRDNTQAPEIWFTKGRCPSCTTTRIRWLVPKTCKPLSDNWDYTYPLDFKRHMHLVTQMDARAELARRDAVGKRKRAAAVA